MKFNAQRSIAKAVFETLEGRQCMSGGISLHDGVLTVQADPNTASSLTVEISRDRHVVTAALSGQKQAFAAGQVKSVVLIGSTQGDYIYEDPHLGIPSQITANGGNDTIWGATGMDTINAGNGNVLIHAGGTINLGSGNDTVWGTGARDTINAGSGTDLVVGGPGNDVIHGGSGNDTLIAGGGTDKIVAGSGDTIMYGSAGNDILVDGSGNDTIYGGEGKTNVVVSSKKTVVHAQPGTKVLKRPAQNGSTSTSGTTSTTTNGGTTSNNSSVSSTTSNNSSSTTTTNPTVPPAPPPPVSPPVAPPPPPAPVPPPPPPATTTPPAGAPSAQITLIGGNGEAGHSVAVNALSSTLGDGTQLNATYNWNFGDSNGAYNNLTGWNAGHIYDNAGTYTISLTVTNDLGLSSTATTQVTVTPDTRTTIYVNTNGNDANSGLSPGQAIASEGRLAQVLAAYDNSNVTVLFARGETFNMPYYLYVQGSNETFSAYGTGAAPVINKTVSPTGDAGVFYMTSSASQVLIENLTFDSPNAAPLTNAPEMVATAIYPNGTNITIRDNTFLNLEDAVDCYQGPNGLLVENNTAPLLTGLRGYFVWMNGTNGTVLGNTDVNSTRQHDMRSNYSSTQDWLIAGNNFASDDNPSDPNEASKTTINLRQGSDIYIYDNTLSDAAVSFGPTEDMPTTAFVGWIVLDGNTINNTEVELHGSVQNARVSNNLTNLSGIYPQYGILPTDDMGRTMSNVTIEDNTGQVSGAVGFFIDIQGDSPAGVLTIENNLFSAPQLQVGNHMASSVFIGGNSAAAVALFSHNVWAVSTASVLNVATGAVNYVAPTGVLSDSDFLNAAQWDSLSNVQDDQFRQVSLSGIYNLQVAIDGQMAGAILPAPLG